MFTTLGLLSVLTVADRAPARAPTSGDYRARIEVWTNRGDDPYGSGQSVRVYFRADQDAYVTVLRVDTDGRVRVLFPREPGEDNFARGGRDYEVLNGSNGAAFYVDDYPGEGYVFAVTAADPFVYDAVESGDHWDYRVIADGRIRGDPYLALTDLARRIVPDGYNDWDYDLVPYYVQQRYDYPRFLCYDCHTYVGYPFWVPYDYTCTRFRIVVFDDPYYYPYRYYGGTRVVFTRPLRPEPRFIFEDRKGSEAFVTRVRERPANEDRRRDVGVRGRDLGGVGIIPPPGVREREQRPSGGEEGRRRRPDRPDHPDHPDHPDRPDRPDHPDHPDRPDRRGRSDQPDRPDRPDHGDRPGRDAAPAPRSEPRAPPRNEPRAQPRSEPRAAPQRDAAREKPRGEPELKRRKP